MRKLIAAINMTLDGFCDHTAMNADDEMESHWPTIVKNPTGNKPTDEFALLIDNISKIAFSRTLKNVDWKNSKLAKRDVKEEVAELKRQAGKNIANR